MNIRRGLFRLWIVLTALWIAFALWADDFSCFYGGGPWCHYWTVKDYVWKLVGNFGIVKARHSSSQCA
jgi:hypothetical protein